MELTPHDVLGTYLIRGVPTAETLSTAVGDYKNVVIFVDFNNIARGCYYPEATESIITSIVTNNGQIPSILISEWIKFQGYLELWAKNFKKNLKCIYFSEHGVSFYHKNLYPQYKAARESHRNITIPTGLISYFDGDITKAHEMISAFMNSSWEWIRNIAMRSNVGTFRLSNLDADFIPEYLFRKVKDFYNEDTCYIIMSSDGDELQVLDFGKNVKIVDSSVIIDENNWMTSKKYLAKDLESIKEFIRSDRIILYKATCGDSSDGIKGVSKLGGKSFAKDLIHLPEEINCDDIPSLKKYYNSCPMNSSVEKILKNWDSFELGIKLVSFKQLIEYLYHIPDRNNLLMKMINENNDALVNNASLSSITVDKAPIQILN